MHQGTVRLPWMWLGLFGLTHGIHEWLDMLGQSVEGGAVFAAVNFSFMAFSFVCLVEFGRKGMLILRGKGLGPWIYVPLALAVAACGFAAKLGWEVPIRLVFRLIGGLWSAVVLFRAVPIRSGGLLAAEAGWLGHDRLCLDHGRRRSAGILLSHLGLESGDIRGMDGRFPFRLCAGLAILIATSIWEFYRRGEPVLYAAAEQRRSQLFQELRGIGAIVVLSFVGWLLTEAVGQQAAGRAESRTLAVSNTLAAAINPRRLDRPKGTTPTESSTNHARLRSNLGECAIWGRISGDCVCYR